MIPQRNTQRDNLKSRCTHTTNLNSNRPIFTNAACRGTAIKELNFRRSDIVVTTKIFWGTRPGPNNAGLSRKQ